MDSFGRFLVLLTWFVSSILAWGHVLKGKIKERRTILDALNVFEGRYLLKMSRLKAISR